MVVHSLRMIYYPIILFKYKLLIQLNNFNSLWDFLASSLEDYLEITPEEMFAIEAKKKIFVNVPLTFERPHGCAFAKDDILSNYFV